MQRDPLAVAATPVAAAHEGQMIGLGIVAHLVGDEAGDAAAPVVQHVQDVVGSVGRRLVVPPGGDVLEESDLTPEQRQVLEDYRMVQYDFSVGRGYGIGPLWYDWMP